MINVRYPSAPTIFIVLTLLAACLMPAHARPFENGRFMGRIAYSADGNHNDPDDWAASPVALAIFAEAGLRDRLVHFDYNSILPLTNPEWEKNHAESVLGTAERYGFDKSLFFDDRRDLDGAIASIVKAINASSAENPLYFIIAGPMEVPYRAMEKCDRTKLKFVYCISHSRWNDGFAQGYKFSFTKRSVIEQDIHWVQIQDQNRRLSHSRYGKPALPEEFAPYFWMRDSRDPKVRFVWDRMVVSTRPDPSDAGMAWFLATGDEECDPAKLKRLLEEHQPVSRTVSRTTVRLEAENFRHLEKATVEDKQDRTASHRLYVVVDHAGKGVIRTRFEEPFAKATGRYDVEIRYHDQKNVSGRIAFFLNGTAAGPAWTSAGEGKGWTSHLIRNVEVKRGDELRVDFDGPAGRIDFVQLSPLGASPSP